VTGTGLYAYAISRGLGADDLAGEEGIGGAPLRLVEHQGLCAVVSEVDLEEFGEEGLRRNLEDLRWLETVAVAHDRVARSAAGHAPTAPLRLATVFLGEDSLRAQLAEWRERAERALDRIEGRSEWSVKAYVDPAPAGEPAAPAPAQEGVGAGRAYLLRRREAGRQQAATAQQDAAAAEELHAALQAVCVAGRRLPPQDRRLTGHSGEMILNGTYLVDDAQVQAFTETVDRLAGQHARVRVQLGGPWPPYSFSSLDAS
jgi:hypothetical protein